MRRRLWLVAALVAVAILMLPLPAQADDSDPEKVQALLPFRYARIWKEPVPVFMSPGDPTELTPVEHLVPPDSWVSIDEEVEEAGERWYRIDDRAYVRARDVLLAPPSAFHGAALSETLTLPVGFVAAPNLNVRGRPVATEDNPPMDTLARYTVVPILGREDTADGAFWYRIGEDRYVHGYYVRQAAAVPRPEAVGPEERWIAVDLSQQTLVAYEGDQPVFATMVSSGLPRWQTPEGLTRIWIKLNTGRMRGGSMEEGDYYYLQDVPWTMYFNRDVGLHAAYWHDGFGTPRSHGCVNLSPLDAIWLFEWTTPLYPRPQNAVYASANNPGTWVYVYKSG